MPSTLHCVLLFGKYRLLLALADENSVQTALKQAKKAIDRRDAIRERPPGFKSFEENSDAWVDCGHVFGLLTRHHDRWPRWNPRSGPKQSSGLESHWFQRAFRIVDSTDRHLCQLLYPGIHARLR